LQYRRTDIAGGTYFFTVNLAEGKRTLLIDQVDVLRKAIKKVKLILAKYRFKDEITDEWVRDVSKQG